MPRAYGWSEPEAVEALRRWAEENGRPPGWNDWRRAPPGCPSRRVYERLFGTWSNALVAAGMEARAQGAGQDMAGLDRVTAEWARRHDEEGTSYAEIGRETGLSGVAVSNRVGRWRRRERDFL